MTQEAENPQNSNFNFIQHLAEALKNHPDIPANAIQNLHKDDDWSFIIKLGALIEIYLGQAIADKLKSPDLATFLTEESVTKKIKVAHALGIIDKPRVDEFTYVTRRRNGQGAHKMSFSFEELFKDHQKANEFRNIFKHTWVDPITIKDKVIAAGEFAIQNPKVTLFFQIIGGLSMIAIDKELERIKANQKEFEQALIAFSIQGTPLPKGEEQGLL